MLEVGDGHLTAQRHRRPWRCAGCDAAVLGVLRYHLKHSAANDHAPAASRPAPRARDTGRLRKIFW